MLIQCVDQHFSEQVCLFLSFSLVRLNTFLEHDFYLPHSQIITIVKDVKGLGYAVS